jgi:NAD-dependent DNA ligase
MKQIFRGKIFSFSGDFGENWAHEQMADWIKAHGGQYEREVSANTTHLICTVEHYKKKTDQGMSP